jgi:SAM-dependent methyltransferase
MAEIEHRVETKVVGPKYSERQFDPEEIADGGHRRFIGGHWDDHGQRQLDFLIEHGLKPTDRFLDVGCGALRAGRHLVDYLEPEHYYGIDANISLLKAGYEIELTDEQRAKLPTTNLRANERFDSDFGVKFDMAIAQSVFTHVSLNHIRLCLFRTAKVLKDGGKFYATFFEEPRSVGLDEIIRKGENQTGKPRFTDRNVYWYWRDDMRWVSTVGPWSYRYIGRWGHPNGQRMVEYTRLSDAEWEARKARRAAKRAAPAAPKVSAASPALPAPLPPAARAREIAGRGKAWALRRVTKRPDAGQ